MWLFEELHSGHDNSKSGTTELLWKLSFMFILKSYDTTFSVERHFSGEGQWKQNERDGLGRQYDEDGKVLHEGVWEKDKFKGKVRKLRANA